jgi:hypothetical protein
MATHKPPEGVSLEAISVDMHHINIILQLNKFADDPLGKVV